MGTIATTENNNAPLLSIITINYNNAEGLKKTIESVLSQKLDDYSTLEYIIVDGGSTDGSVEVIKESIIDTKFEIDWKSEPDKGIYNAMNKGIKKAHGKYCLFLNSGDWLCDKSIVSTFFSSVKNFVASENTVFYGKCRTSKNGKVVGALIPEKEITLTTLFRNTIYHPAAFIPLVLLQKHNYDENLKIVSDWKLFLIALIENYTFVYINFFVSIYDLSGISSINSIKLKEEREKTLQEFLPTYVYKNEEYSIKSPLNKWNYYGKCLYQNKGIFNFWILCTRSFYKFLRILHIMKGVYK